MSCRREHLLTSKNVNDIISQETRAAVLQIPLLETLHEQILTVSAQL